MGLFFGTDGLRGKVNKDLTQDIAYKIGNALCKGAGLSHKAAFQPAYRRMLSS